MAPKEPRYSYLGPVGTFTWEALGQVSGAEKGEWVSVNNVGEALENVLHDRSEYAMIAIENSIEGGVSATQDALALAPSLRIVGEYLVPVRFVLATKPGTPLDSVTTVAAHAVAYAQCRTWLEKNLPRHSHVPARSNVHAAQSMSDDGLADAAIAPPGITQHADVTVVAENIGDNPTPKRALCWSKMAASLRSEPVRIRPASSQSYPMMLLDVYSKCWNSLPHAVSI